MATVKFHVTDDDIRYYAHRALGGSWTTSEQADGRLYQVRECEHGNVWVSVDLRSFLSKYLGYPEARIQLAWDPKSQGYSARSAD